MTAYSDDIVFDLAEGFLAGPEWEEWLAAHPEAAAEVALAQRVRVMVSQLNAAAVALPAGFEQRLFTRLREDAALRDLLTLGVSGIGHVLLDLLIAVFGSIAPPQAAPAAA